MGFRNFRGIFGIFGEFSAKKDKTRQSKQCGFSIYSFDNLKSKSMSGLVFALKDSQGDFDSEYIGFDGTPDD